MESESVKLSRGHHTSTEINQDQPKTQPDQGSTASFRPSHTCKHGKQSNLTPRKSLFEVKNTHKLLAVMCVLAYFFAVIMIQNINPSLDQNTVLITRNADAYSRKSTVCGKISDSGNDAVEESDRESYQSNLDEIRGTYNSENSMKKFVKNEIDGVEFALNVAIGPIIYFAFGVISLLAWLCYCVCCICDPCCPPCKICCKGCKRTTPYEGISKYWPPIGAGFFMLFILITCIIGLASSSALYDSYLSVWCAIIKFFHVIVYSDGGNTSWVGMFEFYKKLDNFQQNLSTFINNTGDTFSGNTSWLNDSQTLLSGNNTLYENSSSLNSNTSYNYTADPSGDLVHNRSSIFFASAFPTIKTVLENGVTITMDAVKAVLQSGEDAGKSITDNSGFVDTFADGIEQVKDVVTLLEDNIISVDDSLSDGDPIFSLIVSVLNAIYGVMLGISILCGVCGTLLVVYKMYKLRYVLHACWCFFSIFMIVAFFLGGLLLFVGIVGFDFCDLAYGMLGSKDELKSYDDFIDADTADLISTCVAKLDGNGSMLEELGISSQLDDIRGVQTSLDNITQQLGAAGQLTQDLALLRDQYVALDAIFDDILENNTFNVSGSSFDENLNLNASLAAIDTVTGDCSVVGDTTWKRRPSECSPLDSFHSAGNNTAVCFAVGGTPDPAVGRYPRKNAGAIVTPNFYSTSDCAVAKTALVLSLVNWRDEKNAAFTIKKNITTDQITNYNQFDASLQGYLAGVNAYIAQAGDYIDTTLDDQNSTGLLSGINCLFFGNAVDEFLDSMCASFFNSVYALSKIILVLAFGVFLGTFFLYCTATRQAKNMDMEAKMAKTEQIQPQQMNEPAKLGGETQG